MENFDKLAYNAETGVFTWVVSPRSRVKAGDVAGSNNSRGYCVIGYNGKLYRAHRLAWVMTYGKWPDGEIDHINGNRKDNRIANLRDVTQRVNLQNQRKPSANNVSGFLGVSWYKPSGKWTASIRTNGKNKNIGYFDDPAIAHEAYLTYKRQMHEGCTI